jgi:hypothetical protein
MAPLQAVVRLPRAMTKRLRQPRGIAKRLPSASRSLRVSINHALPKIPPHLLGNKPALTRSRRACHVISETRGTL